MNLIGSKLLETKRLLLKPQTMAEQKRLWEILMIPSVNDLYLTTPAKFRDKLTDWEKQEPFYIEKMKHANDGDVFEWSIFLKENGLCIGKIDFHERSTEDASVNDKSMRGVGWYIDPAYQGKGYGTEAAQIALDYMFNEVDITAVITGAAIENPASWKIMEKLGFTKKDETDLVYYTYRDNPVEDYRYEITKEEYLSFCNKEIEKLLINFLDDKNRIKKYPSKKKLKNLCLLYIGNKFEKNKIYTEKEVNNLINEWTTFNDAATLRRELYNAKILDRKKDCSSYWLEDVMPTLNEEGMFIKF